MRVIVTRPAAQAAHWVQELHARGIDAFALPLIDIAPPLELARLEQAWRQLPQQGLVVFVSPTAAEQFFAHRPADCVWPDGVVAASIGAGTTHALQQWGVATIIEPPADAPQFDSEALWACLSGRDWAGVPVLIVRGDGGRDWLADTLRRSGAQLSFVTAYRRLPPQLDAAARACLEAAMARPAEHLWFFSSSEAIEHLLQLRAGVNWSASRALATHPRIAERARASGFGAVHETRPTLDAVAACIQSIAS